MERLEDVDLVDLGRRIRRVRRAKGLTQTELGEPLVGAAYISRLEAGNRRPSPKLLLHLAATVGVSADDLMGDLVLPPGQPATSLGDRVAEAAARWLQDPADMGAYIRLVSTVETWEKDRHAGG